MKMFHGFYGFSGRKIHQGNTNISAEMCRGEFFLKHALRGLLGKNYNREKNVRKKDKRKTESNVIGLDNERGLQQVEGESWTS